MILKWQKYTKNEYAQKNICAKECWKKSFVLKKNATLQR